MRLEDGDVIYQLGCDHLRFGRPPCSAVGQVRAAYAQGAWDARDWLKEDGANNPLNLSSENAAIHHAIGNLESHLLSQGIQRPELQTIESTEESIEKSRMITISDPSLVQRFLIPADAGMHSRLIELIAQCGCLQMSVELALRCCSEEELARMLNSQGLQRLQKVE